MKDWVALKARYQQDAPAIQLGALASNLSRIAWHARRVSRQELVPLFQESKYLAEWAAPSCSLDQQGLLAEVQLQLAIWEQGGETRVSPVAMAEEAERWSARLLESAGLVSR